MSTVAGCTVAAIGEVMVEFSPAAADADITHYRLGFAGDTFNTAVSLSRLGVDTAYVTLLGDDPLSDAIIALMQDENIGSALIERRPGRQPGLYVIANSPDGERSFTYWRGESPARELWADEDAVQRLEAQLRDYDCLYLSGITLAIMQPAARQRLRQTLHNHRRRGGQVAFDSNLRLRLWRDVAEAREAIAQFLAVTDIALLTLEDEQLLWGEREAEAILARHRRAGVPELVIKRGADPVLLHADEQVAQVAVPAVADIVDTTGAGDAFNAGYLAGRLAGGTPGEAAARGNRAAAAVIRQRGGIVPRAAFLQAMAGR